jgi:hypothetical protein
MRKLLLLGSLSVGLAFPVSAHQRAAVASSAPAAVAHPVPSAPPAATHAATTRVATSAHPVAPHSVSAGAKATAPHRKPLPPATSGTAVNAVITLSNTPCNKHFSYPIQGLSACPPLVSVNPFFGGAYFIPIPYFIPDSSVQDLPPAQEEVQQIASNDASALNPQVSDEETSAPAASHSGSDYLNETLSEFVFVLRDGTKFFAVAYSFQSDKLQYVTKQGVRHIAALDSLDLHATQKVNEELGNTINLPSLPASGVALNLPASRL